MMIDARSAWRGPELAKRDDWIYHLDHEHILELERAIGRVRARNIRIADVRRDDFPLPTLSPILACLREQVVDGYGVSMLRGLPVDRWSREDTAIAYWGIGTHIGEAVTQNANGHVLGHVKDVGVDVNDVNNRGHRSRAELSFHNDIGGEIVTLLCLRPARSGGLSSIASGAAIYNEMMKRRPDLLAELTRPMYFDRRGEVPEGCKPYYALPVFSRHQGRLIVCFVRRFVESAQRFPELPRLSRSQMEALDMVSELAARPEFRLDITFDPGDIQFVNNLTTMHSRTGYEDYPEPERKRHLLRLWLAVPGGWPLPEAFYERYRATTPSGRAAGVAAMSEDGVTPLDVA